MTPKFFTQLLRAITSKPFLVLSLSMFFIGITSTCLQAQDVLVGLTSNGGPEGMGTAYSIKTDGKAFNVIKGFANWGENPSSALVKANDGYLYGMAPNGGTYGHGTIFRISTRGAMLILKNFNLDVDGGYPKGSLIQATDGWLYGTTTSGPSGSGGIIFKISTAGEFKIIKSLSLNTDGGRPNGHLVQATDGYFYGINRAGGASGYGTIFRLKTDGSYSVLKSFTGTDGAESYGSLMQASDGAFYGMTHSGGTYGYGVIFRYSTSTGYKVLKHLNRATDAAYPDGDLVQGKDGYLYGMSSSGVAYNGIAFKINTAGTSFIKLHDMYTSGEGGNPQGSFVLGSDGYFYGMTSSLNGGYGGSIFKMSSSGTVTVVKKLTPATDGSGPVGTLIRDANGSFYGMTQYGGKYSSGTIFKLTSTTLTVLANMNGAATGNTPQNNLVNGKDSAFFGVTKFGGAKSWGTVFKICGGVTTVIRSLDKSTDGANPVGSLVRGKDGNLYGTTTYGGTNGGGTIFKLTSSGSFSVIRHLNTTTDGGDPRGTLVFGTDGYLYGTTRSGGTGSAGTIFKINTSGTTFKVLHNFVSSTDGAYSENGLVLGKDGNFYGMTGYNTRFYKITKDGAYGNLKTLAYGDGNTPLGNMIIGSDGYFYGTLSIGGTYGYGVIFKINTSGSLTKLRHLNGTTDGSTPAGSLIQGTDGAFYGTATKGGANKVGTIFRISGTSYSVLRSLKMATDGGFPSGGFIISPKINLVANAQSALTTNEDVAKAITLTGSGASNFTFNIVTQPRNGSVMSGTAAARTYTPRANFNGVDSFSFTANFGCLASAPAWVKIKVISVNDAPVLAAIGNKSVVKGAKLSFTATATDPDAGQTKTFSLVSAPSGAAIGSTTGAFSWTPSATGTYTFKVRVTDNGSPVLYDEEQISVTVSGALSTSATAQRSLAGIPVEATTPVALETKIYPNPVNDRFTIEFNISVERLATTITDIRGVVLQSKIQQQYKINKLEMNVPDLKPGLYFIQLQTEYGRQTLKFVKM